MTIKLHRNRGQNGVSSKLVYLSENKTMQEISFTVEGEFVELNQLLKLVGVCDSGGAGKMIVASGEVKVDGQQELRKTAKIRPGQVVELGDLRVKVNG